MKMYSLLLWSVIAMEGFITLLGLFVKKRFVGWIALIPGAIVYFYRWYLAGHMPIFGAHESTVSLVFIGGLVVFLLTRGKGNLFLPWYPLIAVMLHLHGSFYPMQIWALTISERGFWVHLHALLAYGAFGMAWYLFALSIEVLRGYEGSFQRPLLMFFLFYALMMISGVWYRFLLFGGFWSFDPMEAIHLSLFLVWTTLLHQVTFRAWSKKKMARYVLFCFF